MNITHSDVENGILTATVTIPAADVDSAVKKAYRDVAKKYNFHGFRPGKAPRPVIDKAVGPELAHANATEELLSAAAPAIVNELDIVPVKDGDFKNTDLEEIELAKDGEDYTFKVQYKLRPMPELSSYDAVAIEMPPAEVTDAEIDAQVNMLLAYQVKFEDVTDRGVEAEDFLTVDIEDVKNAESLAGEGRAVFVGSGSLPEAVEEALKGMKVDESKEISWTPEAAEGEEAEEATLKATIKSIRARITPELTDELAKETFGFDSVDAMRDAVKLEIEQDKEARLPGIKESRCVAALAERLELEEMDDDYEQSVFQDLGYQVPGYTALGITWVNDSVPTQAQMAQYMANVQALMDVLTTATYTVSLPADMALLTYAEANNIEEILAEINAYLEALAGCFLRSGMSWATAGSPGFYFAN